MADWLGVLIGVLGTLAGVALGGIISYANDRATWQRNQDARWVDERRALYAKVIVECEYIAYDVMHNLLEKERVTYGDFHDEIGPVRDRLRAIIADLELIGTEEDAAAASGLLARTQKLLTQGVTNPDLPATVAYLEWGEALIAFKKRARTGLHLTQSGSQSGSRVGWWRCRSRRKSAKALG